MEQVAANLCQVHTPFIVMFGRLLADPTFQQTVAFWTAYLTPQVSPHFHARPNAPEKMAFWRRSSWYRSMSGRSRCSGMFGMRS